MVLFCTLTQRANEKLVFFFEESDFEWDQFTWQFQLTKGIPQSIEYTYGFEGTYAKVLDAMYTLLGNLDIIIEYEYVSTNVRNDLKRCKKDIAFLVGVLEKAY